MVIDVSHILSLMVHLSYRLDTDIDDQSTLLITIDANHLRTNKENKELKGVAMILHLKGRRRRGGEEEQLPL
jgi:hypothetical protein